MVELGAGRRALDEEASRYVARVRRLDRGAPLLLFDPSRQLEADATVLEVRPRVVVDVGPTRAAARLGVPLTLVLGVAKGDKVDDVLRAATALGIELVWLAETARSVPRTPAEGSARARRWDTIATQAARQSGRGDLPAVRGPAPLGDALGGVPSDASWRVVLDPRASGSLGAAVAELRPSRPAALVVGPEGGLTAEELASCEAAGFERVNLGPLVLRAELAAVVAAGAVTCALRR